MPQKVDNVTDQFDPPWYEKLDPLLKSKQIFKGSFCFPYGSGFGCGESKKVTTGQEFNLSATLGGELKGISGSVTVGTKYTQQDEWSYTAKKCEYCRPQICFPDSTLTIYERYIVPIPFAIEFEQFEPGPQGQIERRCTQNDPLCQDDPACRKGADGDAALQNDGRIGLFTAPPAADALVMRSAGPYKPYDALPDPQVVAQAYSDAIDAQWQVAHVRAKRAVALAVAEPTGDVTYLRPIPSGDPTLSLLSRLPREYLAVGDEPAVLGARRQFVVAVTQCNPQLSVDVGLRIETPDGLKPVEVEMATATGVVTVIAANFDFGGDGLAPGTRALLEITAQTPNDPCLKVRFSEQMQVPPVPWTPQ